MFVDYARENGPVKRDIVSVSDRPPPPSSSSPLPQGVQAPPIRVDFILANEPFVRLINHGGSGGGGGVDAMTAEVILNNRTAEMSDHFPIRAQWTFPPAFF